MISLSYTTIILGILVPLTFGFIVGFVKGCNYQIDLQTMREQRQKEFAERNKND